MSGIRTFLRHCPSCGRRFEMRLVRKESVDSESLSEHETRPAIMASGILLGSSPIVEEDTPVIVDIEEFQYTCKCKHRGHEWSEVHETEDKFDNPRVCRGAEFS